MNELKLFENPEFGKVRVVEIDGEGWFVGKDVAEVLGYADTSDALKRHIDDEDKLTRCFTDSGQSREIDTHTIQRNGDSLPLETSTTRVTTKGQEYFINKFLSE